MDFPLNFVTLNIICPDMQQVEGRTIDFYKFFLKKELFLNPETSNLRVFGD